MIYRAGRARHDNLPSPSYSQKWCRNTMERARKQGGADAGRPTQLSPVGGSIQWYWYND